MPWPNLCGACDSWPPHEVVGGLIFDFGAVRTETRDTGNTPCDEVLDLRDVALLRVVLALLLVVADGPFPDIRIIIARIII